MIRETQARDKSKIFIWNDRYLCSRSNPHKEAQQWVQERSHQVSSSQYVIVLGLACGYHIIELIKTYPNKKIIVLETQKQIVQFFKKNFPLEACRIAIELLENEDDLLNNKEIQKALKNFFVVLSYEPSLNIFNSLKIYQSWLLGRNYNSLQWLLKLRGQSLAFNLNHLGLKDVKANNISIVELKSCLSTNVNEDKELKQKFLTLEELII